MSADPQVKASNPRASVFVAANAGAGKTSTLVKRVARLLLAKAPPEAILCVTYTKAGAAEMQRRLFKELGDWAVMPDEPLIKTLAGLEEAGRDLSDARALFARALETPGGLKIQTIHAFCEKLLRRFPLEAGVSPGFTVLEDEAAARLSAEARDAAARFAMNQPGPIAEAYNHFSVELDYRSFNAMFGVFETRRKAIAAYVDRCGGATLAERDVWRRCGFAGRVSPETITAEAVERIRWGQWKRAAQALLATGMTSDAKLGSRMLAVEAAPTFEGLCSVFLTADGDTRKRLATKAVDPWAADWLAEEQARLEEAQARLRGARVARDTWHAITLASAYGSAYETLKAARGGLDFGDLIDRTIALITVRADAAWVLYKLDGGLEHILLDEAQDTAPDQWNILRALSGEFFVGAGAVRRDRTVFAVGDEKQSIFSFQGAAPERFAAEGQAFKAMVEEAGARFEQVSLTESWRSAPEVLGFVDEVFKEPEALAGLRPAGSGNILAFPVNHIARRGPGGGVEAWPLEITDPSTEPDPWAPVDAPPTESAGRKLARRIARSIKAMIGRGEAVLDRQNPKQSRPCVAGDFLILVRRRNALFHEIIRALKREGVAVGGADRLKLSEHIVFADLMALARFVRFPADDLTLASVLRGPFCDVDEESLFDLAHGRQGSLWGILQARAAERAQWRAARAFLDWAMDLARTRPPFEVFSRVLSRLDDQGRSMRARMLVRFGAEAEDALEAFLAEVLAAEGRDLRDLESVIAALSETELEVKREQEDAQTRAGGEVRVMTVHGAKGLEAPIVILPDTTTRATAQGGPLLDAENGGFLWAPRKADDCPASAKARDARDVAGDHESLRLLYVALTRARDRLIVCGVESQKVRFEKSWRDYVDRAFAALEPRPFALDGGGEGLRIGADPVMMGEAVHADAALAAIPAWARRIAPGEAPALSYRSPSTLGEDSKGPAPSPLSAVDGLGRFRRGEIIHRLLQLLPDLAPDARVDGAQRLLMRERDLTDAQRTEMAGAALAVLNDPIFAEVFAPGSRAEVALAGAAARLPAGLAVSGRVDRLRVTADRVLVIDFKTNRPAPARIEDADKAYVIQMAVYRAVLAEIFPGRAIDAALVWTDGPRLMPVPENLMLKVLDEIVATS